jgi:hypothetical protein
MPREGDRDEDDKHKLDGCSSAQVCLQDITRLMLARPYVDVEEDDSATTIRDELMLYLTEVLKLNKIMHLDNPSNEANALTYYRKSVVERNWGLEVGGAVFSDNSFQQAGQRKQKAREISSEKKLIRLRHQTRIDFKLALSVGMKLARDSRNIVSGDIKTNGSEARWHAIYTLITTVMYSTGSRQTEVVILSDYKPFVPPELRGQLATISNGLISPEAPLLTISPVAKDKPVSNKALKAFEADQMEKFGQINYDDFDAESAVAQYGITKKTSDRVILFGLTQPEIVSFVAKLRDLLAIGNPRWLRLNKSSADDRKWAINNLHRILDFTKDVLQPLNLAYGFFKPRSLRGIYTVLSYKIWAKQPTSEIVWINTILSHTTIDTSLNYNTWALGANIEVLDRQSVEAELASQQARIDELQLKIDTLAVVHRQAPVPPPVGRNNAIVDVFLDTPRTAPRESIKWPKQPRLRDRDSGKLARIQQVIESWKEVVPVPVKVSSQNLRAVGFSSRTIKLYKELNEPVQSYKCIIS